MATAYGRQFCAGYSVIGRPNPPGHIDIEDITTSGWYSIRTPVGMCHTWIECDFETNRNWALVLANKNNTNGMELLRWNDAIKKVNIKSGERNTAVTNFSTLGNLKDYNVWVGLNFWKYLGQREYSDKVTVYQYVSSENDTRLSSTENHDKHAKWTFTDFSDMYAFENVYQISDDTDLNMYNNHLATFDSDEDDTIEKFYGYAKNNQYCGVYVS